jgi:hypothetical protein
MMQEDINFFCQNIGYNWYQQLLEALKLAGEELKSITAARSGYDKDTKVNLLVNGETETKKFTATYYLSDTWHIPSESCFSLQELRLE